VVYGAKSTISWSTTGADNAEIWVSADGELPEELFARSPSGEQVALWIQTGHYYLFKLYEGTAHQHLLAWTSVTTQPRPEAQIGFDYWPANNGWPDGSWGSAALDDANWAVLRPTVVADLDHMASLGAGALRLVFWPEANGFQMGNPATFPPEHSQQARNLVDLLSLCATRNLQVVIAFGNNYFDSGPDATNPCKESRWWQCTYGNTTEGFTSFLTDCKTWIDGYVQAVESSPYRSTVIYYDHQNEYFGNRPFMGWYLTFLHDWSAIPRGKHGCSVLRVPEDVDDLLYQLTAGGGPEQGRRRLDYVDFHSYPDQGVNAYIESCYDYVRSKFPDSTVIAGEFGYRSESEAEQSAGVTDLTRRSKSKGIPYCLNWLLWDDHSIGGFANTTWGYNPDTPKHVLGTMAAEVGLLANPNFELDDGGEPAKPVAWEPGGSVPVTLAVVGPSGAPTAALHRYASLSTSQAGLVWLSSYEAAVIARKRLYINAYLRSNMKTVWLNVIEYDANRASIATQSGPGFTPTDFRFASYLHRVGSWSVEIGPNTYYVIVNVSAESVGPSFLDVAAVSAAQR
jgi:hypothetical protein